MKKETIRQLMQFIDKSYSPYHVISNLKEMLKEHGYKEVKEAEEWNLKAGGSYFVTRNGSSLIAFSIPDGQMKGWHMIASHSDSPTFKIKENPEMMIEDKYLKLNVEKYGGMILSTWLDRALSVAGRIYVRANEGIQEKLIAIDKDLLVIPNVAIHMNRDMNKGVEYNPQQDMCPLMGMKLDKKELMKLIANEAGVKAEDILSHDLFLYVREKGKFVGAKEELIVSPKLDDLQSVFASMQAMLAATPREYGNICAVFDNEEVGSGTKQGADSSFLADVLHRIKENLGIKKEVYRQMLAESFLISADNAHALHPNHPEYADPTNRPCLNGGIVIKYHGSQKYMTDAYSAAVMKELCQKAEVPVQTYCNRSDIPGGSTLGNIVTSHVSIPGVDVGLPQLAMHSAVETAGAEDTEYARKVMQVFYEL